MSAIEAPDWFSNPSADHAPAVYWFWHRRPSAEEIRRQLREVADAGYRTLLPQARLAYPIDEYLDAGFLEAYRLTVVEAASLGLEVGIYDDYNWASGHAGGRTVRGADGLRERHLFWSAGVAGEHGIDCVISGITDIGGGGMGRAILEWWWEDGVQVWDEWEIVSVVAYSPDRSDVRDLGSAATLAETGASGCRVQVDPAAVPEGYAAEAFVSSRCSTSRLINYLLPEAAARFIQVGYEPFADAVGDHFGSTIKYVFLDHPQAGFYTWNERVGSLGNSLLYAPALRDAFERAHGRPFAEALLALVRPLDDASAKLRAAFFQTYTTLACESFLGAVRDWASAHGIGVSGHEMLSHIGGWGLGHGYGTLDTRTAFGDDFFAIGSYRTHTAVDAGNFQPQITARVGDSVARASGEAGCIVEQYATSTDERVPGAAGQWGMTLETMRAAAIRHHLFGARQFLFHGFYQTDGDASSIEPFSNPRFDFAPGINYEPWFEQHADFAAESARLSAFIYTAMPACDVALLLPRVTHWVEGFDWAPYNEHSAAWFKHLSERGLSFHVIDERQLTDAHVDADGGLQLGKHRYGALVLPAVTDLERATLVDLAERLLAHDRPVIASGPLPSRFGSADDTALAGRLATALARGGAGLHISGSDVRIANPLLDRVSSRRPVVRPLDGAPLWQAVGFDGDRCRIALFNEEEAARTVTLDTPWDRIAVERWWPQSGAITSLPLRAGHCLNELTIGPMELCCLVVQEACTATPIVLADGWTLALEGAAPVPIAVDRGWERQGHSEYSGAGTYACSIDVSPDDSERPWTLVFPVVETALSVTLNGESLGRRGWRPYRFDVPRGLLRPGANELSARVLSSAANRYYADTPYAPDGPEPSGLCATPRLEAPTC
jgi:hypothetical protein